MPHRKGEVPPDRSPGLDIAYRVVGVEVDSAKPEDRTLRLVLATESPVEVYDWELGRVVHETLRLDGMEMPKQIPLLDTHDRYSVRSVLGSIRDLERKDGRLVGTAYFGSDDESKRVFNQYAEGHLTDFSVGARRLETKRDEKTGDRTVLRSKVLEGSAVVVGADPNAKALPAALRSYLDPHSLKEEAMYEALRKLLVERGMPADVTEDNTLDWLKRHLAAGNTIEDSDGKIKAAIADVERKISDEKSAKTPAPVAGPKAEDELKRALAIDDLCRKHGVADEDRRKWMADPAFTVERASVEILSRKSAPSNDSVGIGGDIRVTGSEKEKRLAAARDAVLSRSIQGLGLDLSRALVNAEGRNDFDAVTRLRSLRSTIDKPAPGAEVFRYTSLRDLARNFLEASGYRVEGLPQQEICRRALRLRDLNEDYLYRSDTPAYHTTGSFTNLLLDAANKTLLAGYDEAPASYTLWVRQAPSAADYKTLNRIRFGELPDPEIVPENGVYPDKSASDGKESYSIDKYGELFSISLEAIVNDDLNAFARIPAMQGAAMRRKINKVVYAVLTANDALSDAVALFHATHANTDTNALSEANLNTGYAKMMLQTGLSGSGTILNIQPRYLIVPPALSATALKLVTSMTIPDNTAGSTEDARRPNNNPGVTNLYGPGGPRQLVPVIDGQLDSSTTATTWFLAAAASQVDTVEITFLQGEEAPALMREEGFEIDAVRYKIRQSFAAKAIDYRGLYRGNT